MAKKQKLADVLWVAANEYLSTEADRTFKKRTHTCESVAMALGILWERTWPQTQRQPALMFLRQLGCKTGACTAFSDYEAGPERQGVRYMWLLLAMHVAEDEGIEV
jgi:hypothetical protein